MDRTSDFGNPFTIAQLVDIGYREPEARQTAIAEFRPWLHEDAVTVRLVEVFA